MPRHDRPVLLTRRDADHVLEAVRKSEAMLTMKIHQRPNIPIIVGGGIIEAIVTTAITACYSTTYGLGYAQPYIGDATDTDPAIPDPNYPNPVEVRNWLVNSGTIAIGKHVILGNRGLYWLLMTGDC